MTQLILTGLGNEVDLNTGKAIFTAIFNKTIRIEITKEAAETLTSVIYSNGTTPTQKQTEYVDNDYAQPPQKEPDLEGEQFGGDVVTGALVLEDTPPSVYDEETGVEQV